MRASFRQEKTLNCYAVTLVNQTSLSIETAIDWITCEMRAKLENEINYFPSRRCASSIFSFHSTQNT